jgi:Ca-activated chloride channel family protein
MKRETHLSMVSTFILIFVSTVYGQSPSSQEPKTSAPRSTPRSEVTVPSRASSPLLKGEQGSQQPEIEFASASRTVTIKLQVEDPNGYFLPNIRRENFAVYEDGVRQDNVDVEVEHSPVSIALLMESGGRYHELNGAIRGEVCQVGRQLLDVIGRDDKIALLRYNDRLETLADFNQGHEVLERVFDQFAPPVFSEANFYDALLETLDRMRNVGGRKAIIVVSSGIDTFSRATYEQVLEAAQSSGTPMYTIGLAHVMQRESATIGVTAPFARIDWSGAEKQLEMLARASGGRAYVLKSDDTVPAIYDDIMENLRVRYVVTYVSSHGERSGPPRRIRVELIDPKTGEALRMRDSNGKPITAKVFVQESYGANPVSGS